MNSVTTNITPLTVSQGVQHAEGVRTAGGILGTQGVLLAIALGFALRSWWAFGIALVLSFVGMYYRGVALALAAVYTIGWAVIGWNMGGGGGEAATVLCLLGLVVGGAVNFGSAVLTSWH